MSLFHTRSSYSVIGIDIGVSTVSACVFVGNDCKIVTDPRDNILSSSVRFDDQVLYGLFAETDLQPSSLYIKSVKEIIGLKKIPDSFLHSLEGCTMSPDSKGKPMIKFQNRLNDVENPNAKVDRDASIYPEFIYSLLIRYVATQASMSVNLPITHAVVSVPPSYSMKQIHTVKKAVEYTGLTLLGIITDAYANAFFYSEFVSHVKDGDELVIFDLGGSLFHATLLQSERNELVMRKTRNDPRLSGSQIDELIVRGIHNTLGGNPISLREAERIKKELSFQEESYLSLNNTVVTIKRSDLNQWCDAYFESISTFLKDFVNENHLSSCKIVVVGGNTRIPSLQEKLRHTNYNVVFPASPDYLAASGCLEIGKRMMVSNFQPPNVLHHTLYYSFNQKDAFVLFDQYLPIVKCEKLVLDIQSVMKKSSRMYLFDSSDSYLGYFDLPHQLPEEGVRFWFRVTSDGEVQLRVFDKDRMEVSNCQCTLEHCDEISSSEESHFKMTNEFMYQVRRLLGENPAHVKNLSVAQLEAHLRKESILRLCPTASDIELMKQHFKEYNELYKNTF